MAIMQQNLHHSRTDAPEWYWFFPSDCKVWLVSRGRQLSKSLLLFGVNSLLLPPHPWQAAYCRFVYRNFMRQWQWRSFMPSQKFCDLQLLRIWETEIRVTMPNHNNKADKWICPSPAVLVPVFTWDVCVGTILIAVKSDSLYEFITILLHAMCIHDALDQSWLLPMWDRCGWSTHNNSWNGETRRGERRLKVPSWEILVINIYNLKCTDL